MRSWSSFTRRRIETVNAYIQLVCGRRTFDEYDNSEPNFGLALECVTSELRVAYLYVDGPIEYAVLEFQFHSTNPLQR